MARSCVAFPNVLRALAALTVTLTLLVVVRPPPLDAANLPCSLGNVTCLIDAINTANTSAGADTIVLDGSTFTLTAADSSDHGPNGLPSITTDVTIEGHGSIIERSSAAATPRFRLFNVALTGRLVLKDLTLRNGWLPDGVTGESGGGIRSIGELHLINATVTNNAAGGSSLDGFIAGNGGGIYTAGTAHLVNSVVSGNRAGTSTGKIDPGSGSGGSGGLGGGIYCDEWDVGPAFGVLDIDNSTISSNRAGDADPSEGNGGGGGGIACALGTVKITNTTVNENTAGKGFTGGHGGGVYTLGAVVATIVNSTFYGNAAGGSIGDGTVFAGSGGALAVDVGSGTANVTNSTFFANRPGLVVFAVSPLNGKGGAVQVSPRVVDPNTVNIKNSIMAENVVIDIFNGDLIAADCFGATINDLGYNIDWRNSCGFTAATSFINTDPRIVPLLQENGGPTKTFALCTSGDAPDPECSGPSPAVDAIPSGTNDCGSPVNQDQRGFPRPVDGNGDTVARCDIGAFEVQPAGVCGDGVLNPGEECDDGNTLNGDCCSSTCRFEPATTVCRPAAGACDVAEMCTGSSGVCPANVFQPRGMACGDASSTQCTSPDSCDGLGMCLANHRPDGTVCNDSNNCTLNDKCAGGLCRGEQVMCLGMPATICGDDRDNVIHGTSGPDVIHGLGGNDIIFGRGGDDLICGGDGNDIIFAEGGNDKIDGGRGIDICVGGAGKNTFVNCEVRVP